MRTLALLVATVFSVSAAETKLPPPVNRTIDFEKDVQPLLAAKCFSCHGDEAQQSGLRLDRRQQAMRGGDYGPVIIPGKSAESKLIRRVANGDGGLQMPPTGPLSDEEIGILRAWIDQGADYRIQVQDEPAPKPVDPRLASLISAVRGRDAKAAAKTIAAEPALVNAHDATGATPLHHAAAFGDLATMRLLIEKGADVNSVNRRKSPPLFWALHDPAKVALLLEHGADLKLKSIDGRTAVYQASIMADSVGVLRVLLDKGADPNAKTLNGMTPLMAASRGNLEAERLLIARKADVNARNAAGATAVMFAAQTGRPEAVRMLLEAGADANLRTKRNETALGDAATSGNEEVIRMLLDRKVDVNVADIRGYTPLLYAAGSDALPAGVVKMLLAAGASADAKGDGETAAELAAKRGNTAVARVLGASAKLEKASFSERKRTIAEAVAPALDLLAKQSHNFIRIGGCNSCHAEDLPSAAAAIARGRGLPAPKEIPQLPQSQHALNPARVLDLQPVGPVGMGWEMFDFGMNGVGRDEYTDATVRYLKEMQAPSGAWESSEGHRPPMSSGTCQTTALSIYSLKTYGPPAEQADTDKAIARAAAWLEGARPEKNQDRAFRLLGLGWANGKAATITAAAKDLAAQQQEDGGWSQFPTMPTDAYATGEALYALAVAGRMSPNDPVYRKGVKYLLKTQAEDGSWRVASRSIWLQPYFESGFPYGTDQWISAAGTAWATMALSMAAEAPKETQVARR
jgi:ankyrin repeat protein